MLPSLRVALAVAAAPLLVFFGCGDDTSVNPAPASASSSSSGEGASGSSSSGAGGATSSSSSGASSSGSSSSGGGAGGSTTSTSSGQGGSASASSSSSGGAGGLGPGSSCHWGDDCGAGYYCDAPGCGAGTCTSRPSPASIHGEENLVCGCDGATYWNPDSAAYAGAAVHAPGQCPSAMSVACSAQMPCGLGKYCNLQVGSAAQCGSGPIGTCWGLPFACPLDGAKAKACTTQTCETQCALIASNNPWFDDGTCN